MPSKLHQTEQTPLLYFHLHCVAGIRICLSLTGLPGGGTVALQRQRGALSVLYLEAKRSRWFPILYQRRFRPNGLNSPERKHAPSLLLLLDPFISSVLHLNSTLFTEIQQGKVLFDVPCVVLCVLLPYFRYNTEKFLESSCAPAFSIR